jgi:GT2 family glycosyltransferase
MSERMRGLLDDELAALLDGEFADRPADFDDEVYLRLNLDVAAAVSSGVYSSGFEHYMKYGAKEGRRYRPAAGEIAGAVLVPPEVSWAVQRTAASARMAPAMPPHSVELLRISPGGGLFVVGWLDDATDQLAELRVEGEGWSVDLARLSLARQRRRDVEAALHTNQRHAYGFWSLVELGHDLPRQSLCQVRFRMQSGASVTLDVESRGVPDMDLRDSALGYLADGDFFGNVHSSAIASLDGGIAEQIITNNRRLSTAAVLNPYVERFGQTARRPKASIVVCLYGRPEYLFLQNTLFANGPGMEDYEFIYVCNSPDLAERLLRDARIGSFVHGTRQTLVLLAGNAGFGAANNVAVNYAGSDRILAVNPDVFPLQADWAQRHTTVVENLPLPQTALFGLPLYYEDGSLMHGGMHFEIDTVPISGPSGLSKRDLVRVEHYGKGAPPDTHQFTRARPVPAVTGAFISCRREWFERLGGFTEDFVFGHYEDADLCLRSLGQGVAPWIHDIRMWHLEGKGSTRLRIHEGGSLVNRWLFSRRWAAEIRDGLLGPDPTHPLIAGKPLESPIPDAVTPAAVTTVAAAAASAPASEPAEDAPRKPRAPEAKPAPARREPRRGRSEVRPVAEGADRA